MASYVGKVKDFVSLFKNWNW